VAPYGIFTGYMLDGLRGDAATDGVGVTVQQLFDYVSKRVVLSSGQAQRPSFIANLEEFYSLTRYPHPITPSPVFEKDVYLSYDRTDPVLKDWVSKTFRPELEGVGLSIYEYDPLGKIKIFEAEKAIVKSKYTIVLLTKAYFNNSVEELTTAMAIMQVVDKRTPRFIPIQRGDLDSPLYIEMFGGIEMTPQHEMSFRDNMDYLIQRLKKFPHES
jgi:hypothetical protein